MLPISLLDLKKYNKIADVGSAPGGKLFQLISKNSNVVAFEKNKKRALILEQNLKRLNMKANLKINNFLNFMDNIFFDLIILDAPCSSIGTIRRNPEIFFKKKSPDLNILNRLQYSLLEKSAKVLNKKGCIVYMTCSFLETETTDQINKFLKKNKNFSIEKFESKNKLTHELINKEGYILTMPKIIENNIKIDGYFACKLIKNDI